MKKYPTPLKFSRFIKLLLFVFSCFIISPLFFFIDTASININGLQYNLQGYLWLKAIGVSCLTLIGAMAILIQEQVRYSLSGLGIAILLLPLSNLLHPSVKYTNFFIALMTSIVISGVLFKKDYDKLKTDRISNKANSADTKSNATD